MFSHRNSDCTPEGELAVNKLKVGDVALSASGRGSALASKISHIGKRSFEGVLIRATTKGGHSFQSTPNHIVFARLGGRQIYIMFI